MSYSLNRLYDCIGITKQAVHKMLDSQRKQEEMVHQLVYIIGEIRKDHPTMSLRSMYYKIRPDGMGRDKFEEMCVRKGFQIPFKSKCPKTTDSSGVKRFPNLVEGLEVVRPNQVWVSDITYLEVDEKFMYLTFILDMFTRYIKGYAVSSSLRTINTTVPALKMALRQHSTEPGLIIHSDGGGQYYSQAFLSLTHKHEIVNSMCKSAPENPYAERINGTIKNNYLKHWALTTSTLPKLVDRAVSLYNIEKPHSSLKYSTPKLIEEKYVNL